MKLSITDKFLWDTYNALGNTKDILSFMTKQPTMRNFLPGVKNPIFDQYRKEIGKAKFNKLIYYLKSNNYITAENLKGKRAIMLTKKGMNRVLKTSFKIEKNARRKDGKWIMLIFDIPEKYKKSRNLLTSILHNLGYKIFQQSVWVTPYDVSEKTEKLLQFYSLDRFIKTFLIEEF